MDQGQPQLEDRHQLGVEVGADAGVGSGRQ
jgi:hypothetical protein